MRLFSFISLDNEHSAMRKSWIFLLVLAILILSGCSAYKRDLMLRFDDKFDQSKVEKSVEKAAGNYVIQPGDYIRLDVFTNDGERLIDPNMELAGTMGNQQLASFKDRFTYLILDDGTVRLPKIGTMSLQGLTLNEAEELLQESYNSYYRESFVKIGPANRRVVVLGAINGQGASGRGGQVVPLENENMTILEVMALAGGVEQGAKVSSIRLVRGNLVNPKVYVIDLSTVDGMMQSGMVVEAGDIIYIEPWRRPFRETVRDVSPILSVITSVTTLVFVIQNTR